MRISLKTRTKLYQILGTRDLVKFDFQGTHNEWMEFRRFVANRSDLVEIVSVCDRNHSLSVRTVVNFPSKPKISVGIVFSGNQKEYSDLYQCVASFCGDSAVGEIIILTSVGFTFEAAELSEYNIRVVEIPIEVKPRVLYCRKKNWIIENAQFDLVLIAHTRIRYIEGLQEVYTRYWDIACGHVTYMGRGNLDLIFTKRTTSGLRYVRSDLLPTSRWHNWDSFVDGGCFLVRRNHLASLLDERLAWSEQEDYDFCLANTLKSREIVKFKQLKFETSSNKLKYKNYILYWPIKIINFARWF